MWIIDCGFGDDTVFNINVWPGSCYKGNHSHIISLNLIGLSFLFTVFVVLLCCSRSVSNLCMQTLWSLFLLIFLFALSDTASLSICRSLSIRPHAIIAPISTSSHQLCHRGDLEQHAADWLLCWWFKGHEPQHLELMDSVALQGPRHIHRTPTSNRWSMGVTALTNLIMWTNDRRRSGNTPCDTDA